MTNDNANTPEGAKEGLENSRCSVLSEAMQDVWNDHCNDTGCHPDCVEQYDGREVIGTFTGSRFADDVEKLLKSRGHLIS